MRLFTMVLPILLASPLGWALPRQDASRQLAAPLKDPKEYHSIQEILQAIPADIEPTQADHWTEVQIKVANEWLAKNVVGHKSELPLVVENVTRGFGKHDGEWVLRSTVRMKTPAYVLVLCYFRAAAEAKLVKIEKNQHVTIGGTLSKVELSGSGSVTLAVEMSNCEIK